MRFEDGRIDQFVSDQKTISTAERDELFVQYRRRGRDFIPVAVQQIKNSYSGSDTGYEDITEEQAAYVKSAEELAENGYQDDSDDADHGACCFRRAGRSSAVESKSSGITGLRGIKTENGNA